MEIARISEECVKPSSPTPLHLKTYKISLLDQVVPFIYFPLTLFYPIQDPSLANNVTISERSTQLKQSLSETLTSYYPLAGKMKDTHSIDCNDEGVRYVEATANVTLSECMNLKGDLSKLLPDDSRFQILVPGTHVVMIQETRFTCGGFTIGVVASHMIMDATSLSSFMNHWAAIMNCKFSYTQGIKGCPNFDSSSMFPQYDDEFPGEATITGMVMRFCKVGKLCVKRFVFEASAIVDLKVKAISLGVENPTRVEVVSSLLIQSLMAVFNAKISNTDKIPILTSNAVNLRRRADPPFSKCSIGNFILLAAALLEPKEASLSSLAYKMREAIGKFNGEFVKELQGEGGLRNLCERVKETSAMTWPERLIKGGARYVSIVSWCNLGFYDVDFGWGKPGWATNILHIDNSETLFVDTIYLLDAKDQKGIEAAVVLDPQDMLMLENDEYLLRHACVDPFPLN